MSANPVDISTIRNLYEKSATDESSNEQLLALLKDVGHADPLLLGYKASATMTMAKFTLSPFSKLSHFNKGKAMLEQAIRLDEKNIELRLLRLMVQANAPSFLGYTGDKEADKQFILRNISHVTDRKTKVFVSFVLSGNNYLDSDEKALLETAGLYSTRSHLRLT